MRGRAKGGATKEGKNRFAGVGPSLHGRTGNQVMGGGNGTFRPDKSQVDGKPSADATSEKFKDPMHGARGAAEKGETEGTETQDTFYKMNGSSIKPSGWERQEVEGTGT